VVVENDDKSTEIIKHLNRVKKDDKSTEIIKHLNQHEGGRVTFIPLNRVNVPCVTYPQSSDVIPLLNKLNFKPEYTPAFRQVSFYSSVGFYMAWYLQVICSNHFLLF
jgi:hypothetical protein